MKTNEITPRYLWIATGIVLVAAFSRLMPHPYNFTPIGAMALFSGAIFHQYRLTILIPFIALWLSDIALNNTVYGYMHDSFQWAGHPATWLGFAAVFLIGRLGLGQIRAPRVAGFAILSSVVFFLLTNFVSWQLAPELYSRDFAGLIACYTAGLPFFGGTIAGDLFYSAAIFTVWHFVTKGSHPVVHV